MIPVAFITCIIFGEKPLPNSILLKTFILNVTKTPQASTLVKREPDLTIFFL